jgi:hypothetical protein
LPTSGFAHLFLSIFCVLDIVANKIKILQYMSTSNGHELILLGSVRHHISVKAR